MPKLKIDKTKRDKKLAMQKRMKRYNGDNLENLDLSKENLHISLVNVLHVSKESLQNKILKQSQKLLTSAKEMEELDCILNFHLEDINQFNSLFCNKTGKLLSKIPAYSLELIQKLHTPSRIFDVILRKSLENYSYEWLHTDPVSLDRLMIIDPEGFFIYATSHIFQHSTVDNLQHSFSSKAQNHTHDSELLFKASFLHDKIEARKQLQTLKNSNPEIEFLLLEINELLRRLLGLAKPTDAFLTTFFKSSNLPTITKSVIALKTFKEQIQENLKFLMRKHFNKINIKTRNDIRKLNKVTSADLEAIKKELKGLTLFYKQRKVKSSTKAIKASNKLNAIGFSLEINPINKKEIVSTNNIRATNDTRATNGINHTLDSLHGIGFEPKSSNPVEEVSKIIKLTASSQPEKSNRRLKLNFKQFKGIVK